jgi:hypothetical protein
LTLSVRRAPLTHLYKRFDSGTTTSRKSGNFSNRGRAVKFNSAEDRGAQPPRDRSVHAPSKAWPSAALLAVGLAFGTLGSISPVTAQYICPGSPGAAASGGVLAMACGTNTNANGGSSTSDNIAMGSSANASDTVAPANAGSQNLAVGLSADAHGGSTQSSNVAIGRANASGDGSSNNATGNAANASGDQSQNVAFGDSQCQRQLEPQYRDGFPIGFFRK